MQDFTHWPEVSDVICTLSTKSKGDESKNNWGLENTFGG